MNITEYMDIIILGLAITGIGMLGFLVFFNNRTHPVNRAFLTFSLISIIWGSLNFFSYQATTVEASLWLWRSVIFSAVWFCFVIFHISLIFPGRKDGPPRWHYRFLTPLIACISLLTLTPLVFSGLAHGPVAGQVPELINGPLIPLFGLTVAGLVLGAVYNFVRNMFRPGVRRGQFVLIMLGTFVTFTLLIIFNFVLPTVYKIYLFIPYGAVFILPFIAAVGYAIARYKLFNVRIIATEAFAFVLVIVSVLQIFFSASTLEIIFRMSVFVLIFIFAILLVRGTVNEMKQREQIESLAAELEIKNKKLQELDKLKSQFLSIATHELRSPLTIVRNFIALMLDGSYGKIAEAAMEAGRQVLERVNDMASSVETYLNVSKIEQGKISYDFTDTDFTALVKQDVAGQQGNASKRGLALGLTVASGAEKLQAKIDAPKINEVINNLIDNSLKYTPQGSVSLKLEKADRKARLTITDTGVGMSQKTMDGLFKLFSPGEDSKKVNPASTGVGLYITKAHVDAHKGTLTAHSDGPGKGSQFVLELPLI